jgi:hypothetical protein
MFIPEMLVMALEKTLEAMEYDLPTKGIQTWMGVGNVVVVTSIFVQRNVALVWDGAEHVDMNLLFCLDQSRDLEDKFVDLFLLEMVWELHCGMTKQPSGNRQLANFLDQVTMMRIPDHVRFEIGKGEQRSRTREES